jgi:Tol biopolymer transport system component
MTIHGIAWAPDDRSLIYAVSPTWWLGAGIGSQLWRIDVDGARPAERIESSRVGSFAPATVPSRHRLVFSQSRFDIDIFRFESPDRATPVVASSFVDYAPSFSPDGRRIAFESSRSGEAEEIWTSDPDGAHPFQVTGGPVNWRGAFRWRGNPNWSPDGSRLVFSTNPGDDVPDVWIVDADGGSLRRLTNDPSSDAVPVWSRDGWIYYRKDRVEGGDIVRVRATGGTIERITQHGALYPMISQDGKTLFYTVTEQFSPLFSHSIDNGSERRLAECVEGRALATSAGGLYYIGCASGRERVPLYRLDLASGRKDLIGMLDQGLGRFPGLAVSPDAKTILFGRAGGEGADLMMFEDFR